MPPESSWIFEPAFSSSCIIFRSSAVRCARDRPRHPEVAGVDEEVLLDA